MDIGMYFGNCVGELERHPKQHGVEELLCTLIRMNLMSVDLIVSHIVLAKDFMLFMFNFYNLPFCPVRIARAAKD